MAEDPDARNEGVTGVGRRRNGHAGIAFAGAQADLKDLVVVAEQEARLCLQAEQLIVRNSRGIRQVGRVTVLDERGEGGIGVGNRARQDRELGGIVAGKVDDLRDERRIVDDGRRGANAALQVNVVVQVLQGDSPSNAE